MALSVPESENRQDLSRVEESQEAEIRENLDNITRTVSSDVMSQRPGPDTFLAALPQDIRDEVDAKVNALKDGLKDDEIPQSVKEYRTWNEDEKRYIVALQRVLDKEFPNWDKDYGYIRRFK